MVTLTGMLCTARRSVYIYFYYLHDGKQVLYMRVTRLTVDSQRRSCAMPDDDAGILHIAQTANLRRVTDAD